jgi:hypothetical protein
MSDKPGLWLPALAGTREGWERAYERLAATPAELALMREARDPTRDDELETRRCAYCDQLIPTDRDERARFCNDMCRRRFNYGLEQGRNPRLEDPHGVKTPRGAIWPTTAGQPCEHCAANWVPTPGRFCSSWCEEQAARG